MKALSQLQELSTQKTNHDQSFKIKAANILKELISDNHKLVLVSDIQLHDFDAIPPQNPFTYLREIHHTNQKISLWTNPSEVDNNGPHPIEDQLENPIDIYCEKIHNLATIVHQLSKPQTKFSIKKIALS